jgi:multidrug efflux pump subunit AcrA (membrane-fusion protein)
MMPGMTVKAEIVVETVKDAIYVPVEAVYNREGQAYARLKTLTGDTEIKVETGRSSVHYVEILSGIKDGDEVMLFRRAGAKK